MAEGYNYYINVRVVSDSELTNRQANELGNTVLTLAQTAGFASDGLEGVKNNLRVVDIQYVHQHESTDDMQCGVCRNIARDGVNSRNIEEK